VKCHLKLHTDITLTLHCCYQLSPPSAISSRQDMQKLRQSAGVEQSTVSLTTGHRSTNNSNDNCKQFSFGGTVTDHVAT